MIWFKKDKQAKEDHNSSKNQNWNKDLKRNNSIANSAKQQGLNFLENIDTDGLLEQLSPKQGLSVNFEKISLDQHHILSKCELESSTDELMEILERTDKSLFQKNILDPLIEYGFFERIISNQSEAPKERFRLTVMNIPGCNFENVNADQIKILRNCKLESSADELMKILKRTNKSRFKNDILNPLIKCDFFERTILDKPKSPNQKYRFTGKFVQTKLI
ncbi:Fic family protein [Candidatus Thioglobus sp.]|uniref:Fic family protein n=1 Tax=Candidatus Thioglobus sp. TaxID=2026721 RepID=UPI0026150ED0|nr:hypothetical protein [Candidatus Thioglobus sp.]MDG2395899.1 hypothetical protein [Candidatus Thioglobus sp.]